MIYLDNAATSFPKPEVVYDFMNDYVRNYGVNVGRGSYHRANEAANLVEETRERLRLLFNLNKKSEVVFSPSATISINLILKGIDWKKGDIVYYSPFEHNAVLRTLYDLEKEFSISLIQIPVDKNTMEYKLDKLESLYKNNNPRLIAISQVSNVCGVIAPIERIAKLTHNYKGLVMVDGAQAAGLLDLNLTDIDYYIWSGHKTLYGPFGIAGFIIDKNSPAPYPLVHGGTGNASENKEMPDFLPAKYEAGSLNIQAIAGLNASLRWIDETGREKVFKHEEQVTKTLIKSLEDFIDVQLFLPQDLNNHLNVVSACFSGYTPQEIGKILNEKFDIAVRTGLHCAPETHRFLGTMPHGTVRFSVGFFNTEEDISKLQDSLGEFII